MHVPQSRDVEWAFFVLGEGVVMIGRYGQMGFLRRPKKVDYEAVDEALRHISMKKIQESPDW